MKALMATIYLLTMISGKAFSGNPASELSVELDKGTLRVSVQSKMKDSFGYEIKIPEHCKGTEVDVKDQNKKITFSHKGKYCSEGATILFNVKSPGSLQALVKAGNLELSDVEKLVKEKSLITASVKAGLIQSSVKEIKPVRTKDYAGMEVSFGDEVKGQPKVKLEVDSGNINLNQ
jgi:hypothetical protein